MLKIGITQGENVLVVTKMVIATQTYLLDTIYI